MQATERLRDGTQVTIRAIRPDDKDRMRNAFRELDPQSVYTRVFHMKRDLSDEELRRLTEVDPDREVALVVTTGSPERIIAGARYVAVGDSAEIAFSVEEDFQRLGIASRLLRHLASIAQAKGIAQFEAFVLPENGSMLEVFRRSGFAMGTKREDGVVRVTLDLS